ncbi:immune-associated nucleotide-binding protein 13-like [Melanotaenia boesemani]|uniref:immune-associated nucleotide-binding protein 13-like n=1 Tax=Melanotaenia boesemani TaxID=1250792 RepID=UPI001C04DD18|nr:immune-associated nucleotide-binding protein 13-like [Melanotaenia boesemani]XP_041841623.1 immune-associated nucleotide-binding protein 13-like [Melanotaenia boesemani]
MMMEMSNKKQNKGFKSQFADNKPKDETSNKTNNRVSRSPWLKLAGSAAGGLGEVFLGSSVVVLQDREVKAPAEDTTNSAQKRQEYNIKVGVYNAFMPTQPEQGAEGRDAQEPGKGVTSKVKTERVPPRILIPGPAGTHKCIKVLKLYRIVLLGEAGAGKSSLGNNIFGENVFKINQPPKCRRSRECQVEAKSVHGRRIMLVDTPGFDGTDGPEPDLKDEILRGITECAHGPHAFLIVLKVEKFTNQKKAAIEKICQLFSEDAFKYAAVVFILGDQLPEGIKIKKFVDHNKCLTDLVKKCSGGYHVVDNRCNQENDCNQLQILQLLNTIEKMVMENKGGCYTSKLLQAKKETGNTSVGNLPQAETENEANNSACRNMWIKLSGPAGDAVAEAFFGPTVGVVQEICKDKDDGESSTGASENEAAKVKGKTKKKEKLEKRKQQMNQRGKNPRRKKCK